MFGLSIIETEELERLKSVDEAFTAITKEKDKTIELLRFKVSQITAVLKKYERKRDERGRFVK